MVLGAAYTGQMKGAARQAQAAGTWRAAAQRSAVVRGGEEVRSSPASIGIDLHATAPYAWRSRCPDCATRACFVGRKMIDSSPDFAAQPARHSVANRTPERARQLDDRLVRGTLRLATWGQTQHFDIVVSNGARCCSWFRAGNARAMRGAPALLSWTFVRAA